MIVWDFDHRGTLVEELMVDNGCYSRSSLEWAVEKGIASLVQMITGNPDNAVLINDVGSSCIGVAAKFGYARVVQILLDNGYPIDQTTSTDPLTPLAIAASYQQIDVVDLLIKRGADINAKVKDGETPLHCVAQFDNVIIPKKLLENGADIRIRTEEGRNPIHMAARNHNKGGLSFLLDWCVEHDCQDLFHSCDNWGTTLLHEVCRGNFNIGFIDRLLSAGVLPDVLNDNGESPLMKVFPHCGIVFKDDHEAEDKLLEKVKLLSRNPTVILHPTVSEKKTSLHYAIEYADSRPLEWLLEHGGRPGVNQKDIFGNTPLLLALACQNTNVAQFLLRLQDIDVTLRRNTQETALHIAADRCTPKEISSILGRHPALLNAVDKNGRTPLLEAFSASRLDNCEYLLTQGADPYIADITGQTPLRWASERTEEIEFLQLLLDRDIVSLDQQGNTRLHQAVRGVSVDRVSALLRSSDINLHNRNAFGETALHIAVRDGYHKTTERMIHLLLENNRDCTLASVYSNGGKTALDFALERGRGDSIGILAQPMWKSTVGIEWDSESFVIQKWCHEPWHSDLLRIIDEARPVLAAQTQQLVNECGGLPFTVSRNTLQNFVWGNDSEILAYICLQIPPGPPSPVRCLVFTMISNDQGKISVSHIVNVTKTFAGWSDRHAVNQRNEGSYCGSRTWFEVGISKPDQVNRVTAHREIQRNIHTSSEKRVHTVIWDISDESPGLREWLSNIQGGDLLHVYPKAYQFGWRNCVHEVAVTVFHQRPESEAC
ncbi:ankyrin repeat-containing domain protein [Penicillium malachiteum]|nr:ankyrin repeat-containing domain protein [Penicillium malachiteum]